MPIHSPPHCTVAVAGWVEVDQGARQEGRQFVGSLKAGLPGVACLHFFLSWLWGGWDFGILSHRYRMSVCQAAPSPDSPQPQAPPPSPRQAPGLPPLPRPARASLISASSRLILPPLLVLLFVFSLSPSSSFDLLSFLSAYFSRVSCGMITCTCLGRSQCFTVIVMLHQPTHWCFQCLFIVSFFTRMILGMSFKVATARQVMSLTCAVPSF